MHLFSLCKMKHALKESFQSSSRAVQINQIHTFHHQPGQIRSHINDELSKPYSFTDNLTTKTQHRRKIFKGLSGSLRGRSHTATQ